MVKKNPSFKTRGKLGKPSIGKESFSISLAITESPVFDFESALKFLRKSRLALTIYEDNDPEQAKFAGMDGEHFNVEADCQGFTTNESGFAVTLNFGNGIDPHTLINWRMKNVYVVAEKIGNSEPKAEETANTE